MLAGDAVRRDDHRVRVRGPSERVLTERSAVITTRNRDHSPCHNSRPDWETVIEDALRA